MSGAICNGNPDYLLDRNRLLLVYEWYEPHLVLERKRYERQDTFLLRVKAATKGARVYRTMKPIFKKWGII